MSNGTKQFITTAVVKAQKTRMVQLRKDETGEAWGSKAVADVTATIELTIDVEKLIKYLGRKALLSKSGVSRGMSGDIVVKVVKSTRRETEYAEPQEMKYGSYYAEIVAGAKR